MSNCSLQAKVEVNVKPLGFSSEQNELILRSAKCQIDQDGSVHGRNFLAIGSYALKASDYQITLSGKADNTVQLGPTKLASENTSFVPVGRVRRGEHIIPRDTVSSFLLRGRTLKYEKKFQGIVMHGTANTGYVNSFRFTGTIRTDSQSDFLVYLTSPVKKLLEQASNDDSGYTLNLKSGRLKFRYKANGSNSCKGSFTCDLLFPKSYKDVRSPAEQLSLKDILLFTQGKGTLSNYVDLLDDSSDPYRVEIQNSNLIVSAIDAGAYAYFPNWPTDGIIIDFEKLASDTDDAISVRIDEQHLDPQGKIINSEILIPSLFSDKSGVKGGVRFDANFNTEGIFTLLNWDSVPYFGTSHHRSFEARLSNISLAPYQTNPHTRGRDFLWEGSLKFPFFSGEAVNSRIPIHFNIKDFIPELDDPIEIAETAFLPAALMVLATLVHKMKYLSHT